MAAFECWNHFIKSSKFTFLALVLRVFAVESKLYFSFAEIYFKSKTYICMCFSDIFLKVELFLPFSD